MLEPIAEVAVEPEEAQVYEHGWQSWSPSTKYRLGERPYRPTVERRRVLCYRPGVSAPSEVYWGEGLLAIRPADEAPTHLFAATHAGTSLPSIKAELESGRLIVSADGEAEHAIDDEPGSIEGALARWAVRFAANMGVSRIRSAPTVWCSWYHYFTAVTEADMVENLESIGRLDLPIEVVQLDDGYQSEIGDWLSLSDRFSSLQGLIDRIRAAGRRAGIWVAPFLVGSRSRLAAEHPDWLVGGADAPADAGWNWSQDLYALDTTHPGAQQYLKEVFSTLAGWGIDYFKIDFIYAGAVPGRRHLDLPELVAYRNGVELIRAAIGDGYLLGSGAPILPSVGLVDAMRVSPDTAPHYEPADGDMSQPASRAAMVTGVGRAFMQGRLWVNDPDCLIVRPAVERRREWADHVRQFGGLRASSDRLADLDSWGLDTTREILSESPTKPFIPA